MGLNLWQRSLLLLSRSTRPGGRSRRVDRRYRPEVLSLEERLAPAVYTFTNSNPITINDFAPATPFPSDIVASGVVGLIGDVNVTLSGFNHTFPSDVGVMLVGPQGQNIYLMDAAGGGTGVSGLNFTFDDQAAAPIPQTPLSSGSWQCASYAGDVFDPPAPFPSGSISLSDFNGTDANGTWSLYVQDFAPADMGSFDFGWSITITTANAPPTISDIPDQTINEDTNTGAIPFTVDDPDTPPANLTLTGTSSNPGLVPNANIVFGGAGTNRTVTVTPRPNQNGTATITVTVSDGNSTATDTFLLTVNPVDDPPTISNIADRTINQNTSTGAIPFTVGDIDNPVASLTLSGGSSNTTLVPVGNIVFGGAGANRTVTVTPVVGQAGVATITVTVSDGTLTASDTFVLTVNALPTISNIGDTAINEDTSTGAIPFTVGDAETPAGALTVTAVSSNTALVPNANVVLGGAGANRTVSVTPIANGSGSTTITVTVTDGNNASTQDTFIVTVNPVNDAPTAIINGLPATFPPEGSPLFLTATQTDIDSTAWTYQWSVVSSNGQVIAPSTNQNFNFTPDNNGSYTVTLIVTDNGQGPSLPLSGTTTSIITVVNAKPTPLPGGPYSVFAGSTVQLFGSATDPGTRDTVTLKWDLDGDGLFGETGTNATRGNETAVNPIYRAPIVTQMTNFVVGLQATDNDGASRIRHATVTVFPVVSRFDFNAASQVTQAGYFGVRGGDLFDFANRGYGWAAPATEFDNGGPTPALRDGHSGTDNTFSVRVVPGAVYQVTAQFRDVNDRSSISVYAEGALRSRFKLIGSRRFSDLVPAGFDATVTVRFDVSSADGILDLRFTGAGGSSTFVVNSLQLAKK